MADLTPEIQKEAKTRLADAKAQKRRHDQDIREGYFFTAPQRALMVNSDVQTATYRPQDNGVLQTSIAMQEAENFSTTLIESFMPEGVPWIDLLPSVFVPEVFEDEVVEVAAKHLTKTFGLISQSNFYAALPGALNPDASIGTFALWVDEPKQKHLPPKVHAIPLRELDIDVGPDGEIDTRFATRHTKWRNVKTLIGEGIALPPAHEAMIANKPNESTTVRWGFWRDWSRDDVVWHSVVMVKDEVVLHTMLEGEGSCPLLPIPFNRYPEWAFGEGPAIKALPELRQVDDLEGLKIKAMEVAIQPPMAYPDDSFANIEQGVESGGWYPVRPGTEGAIKPMYEPPRLDPAYFELQLKEKRIRQLFYNDFPEQRGDTPPTATQWVDEMAMAQRRIGTPGLKFWADGPRQIFLRFYWIAKQRGLLPPLRLEGISEAIALAPYNPTQRAKNQQKVAMAARAAQLALGMFPEEFKAKVDGQKSMDALFTALDVKEFFPDRPQQQVEEAVGMLEKLAGADPSFARLQPGAIGGQPA